MAAPALRFDWNRCGVRTPHTTRRHHSKRVFKVPGGVSVDQDTRPTPFHVHRTSFAFDTWSTLCSQTVTSHSTPFGKTSTVGRYLICCPKLYLLEIRFLDCLRHLPTIRLGQSERPRGLEPRSLTRLEG